MEYLLSDLVEKETGTQFSINHGEPAAFFVDKIHGTLRYPPPKGFTAVKVVCILEGIKIDLLAYFQNNLLFFQGNIIIRENIGEVFEMVMNTMGK